MKFLYVFMIFLPLISACTRGPIVKAVLDEEVKRMCEIDGGMKVYESVLLPPNKFDKWGQVRFSIIRKEDRFKKIDSSLFYYEINSEYYYDVNIREYSKGEASLRKTHFYLYRSIDDKLLGEAIVYSRKGGDVYGSWHESYFSCPSGADISTLKEKIFRPEWLNDEHL